MSFRCRFFERFGDVKWAFLLTSPKWNGYVADCPLVAEESAVVLVHWTSLEWTLFLYFKWSKVRIVRIQCCNYFSHYCRLFSTSLWLIKQWLWSWFKWCRFLLHCESFKTGVVMQYYMYVLWHHCWACIQFWFHCLRAWCLFLFVIG